jgi:hypothetical protein
VEFQIGRERSAGTAQVIEPTDPRYERLWQIVNANNHDRYSAYQRNTNRPIPVIAVSSA